MKPGTELWDSSGGSAQWIKCLHRPTRRVCAFSHFARLQRGPSEDADGWGAAVETCSLLNQRQVVILT